MPNYIQHGPFVQRLWLLATPDADVARCPMDLKDPYRVANLLIQQYGTEAKAHAMQRALELRAEGDESGEWVWIGVFEAVLDLQSTWPANGQATH